jgi:hypothetical protein
MRSNICKPRGKNWRHNRAKRWENGNIPSMKGKGVNFGRDGIPKVARSPATKLDLLLMHMQGIQVDLIGPICKDVLQRQ